MHPKLKTLIVSSALGLSALFSTAHAQLNLTGSTYGTFLPTAQPNTTIVNGPVVSTFSSGIPYRSWDTQTSVTFTGSAFSGVESGDTFSLGSVKFKNGMTALHSTATFATMDLFLNIPAHGVTDYKLTTLMFGIDNTDNHGVQDIPDLYYIGHTLPSSVTFNGNLVLFNIGFTDESYTTAPGHTIHENATGMVGITADVRFVPVPEPSTYAIFAGLGLVGLVAARRLRRAQAVQA